MRSVRSCLLALVAVLLLAGPAGAQDGRGALVKAFRNLQAGTWSILDIDAVRRHARAGDRQAAEVWAWMNATGTAVPPNPLEAFRWYIHAAELGAPRALQNARVVWAVILPHRRPQLSPELEQRLQQPDPPPRASAPAGAEDASVRRLVIAEALRAGIPPGLALAVAHVESRFDPRALSPVGARGVMQMMPQTALGEFGVHPDRLWDAATNVRLGVAYLVRLMGQYNDVAQALAHYNGGTAAGAGTRVLPETQAYVRNVVALWNDYEARPTLR